MIDFAIITAPREKETLTESVNSFNAAFPGETIGIFAEPGDYNIPANHRFHTSEEKYGCFKNYDRALKYLIDTTKKQFICVLSDDCLYSSTAKPILYAAIDRQQKHYAAYSLFTAKQNIQGAIKIGWNEINPGWNGWGGAFVIPTAVARQVIQTRFYKNHLVNYAKNEQIDACMYSAFAELRLPSYVHNPSLIKHMDAQSTLGHVHYKEENAGYNFKP